MSFSSLRNFRIQDFLRLPLTTHVSLSSLSLPWFAQDGFKNALKNAFEHFINLRHNSSASLIAKFVDRQLKGEKGTTEQEVEARLDQVSAPLRLFDGVAPSLNFLGSCRTVG